MKDSFILYNSFYDPLKLLTDEQLGRLFRAIFEFNINGSEEVSNDIKMAFAFIKNQLIVDSKKYENTLKRKSEAGKRGMKSRWSNSKENITEITNDNSVINDITKITEDNSVINTITNITKITDNENVNDNENENVNVNVNDISKKEINKEKEISFEDKSSTDDTAKASKKKEVKHKYGVYKHVLLKDEELQKLKKDYSNWEELIRYLDEYIEMKGYKAKSHYLCIKKWVVDAVKRNNSRQVNNSKGSKSYQSYSQREYESSEDFYDSDYF